MLDKLKSLVHRLGLHEKARLARVARALLLAIAGLGWLTIDEATVNAVATAVAAIGSALLTPTAKQDTQK